MKSKVREATITKAGVVVLRFPYDEVVIAAVKDIPGRKWHNERKVWYFLLPDAHRLWTLFNKHRFAVSEKLSDWLLNETHRETHRASYHDEESHSLIEIPKVVYPPWGHQKRAYAYLQHTDAALLDMYMGTGKSRVIVDHVVNTPTWYTLIVCPKAVIPVWPYQFNEHAAEHVEVWPLTEGTAKDKANIIRGIQSKLDLGAPYQRLVVVINYESAWRSPLGDALRKIPWDLIVLDESHRIKAPGGKASRYMAHLSTSGRKRLCLTGTPMPHSPMDIYGQYRFLMPGIFGTQFAKFCEEFAIMGGFNHHQIIGYKNEDKLAELMNRIRFHAGQDVLDLPPVVSTIVPVAMAQRALKTYISLEKNFYAEVANGVVTIDNVLVKILRLQQMTSGHVKDDEDITHTVHTSKIDALEELLTDIAEHEPVVVFCRFRWDLDAVHEAARKAGRESFEFSGRAKELEKWSSHIALQEKNKGAVIAVQISAGGEGIDLTRAHYCIYFSFTHSLGQWEQAHARIHRPGQSETVFNMYLSCVGTIDETMIEAQKEKKDVVQSILDKPMKGE